MAIRPLFRKAVQTQIDWPLVGVAGGMAGLLVLSTTLMAFVASRSGSSVGRASGSPIGLGEFSDGATQSVGAVGSHAERGDEEFGQLPSASYPEGDEQAVAPGATRSNGSAGYAGVRASPSRTDQKGQKQPGSQIPAGPGSRCQACEREGSNEMRSQVAFAKDPAEAAVLAKQEHKLMFVLHVSGNFEESKFT